MEAADLQGWTNELITDEVVLDFTKKLTNQKYTNEDLILSMGTKD